MTRATQKNSEDFNKLRENQVEQSQWSSYEGLPVVIAKHLTLVPSPSELVNNPEAFLNQRITVYGEIEPSESAKTFIVTSSRRSPETGRARASQDRSWGFLLHRGSQATFLHRQ